MKDQGVDPAEKSIAYCATGALMVATKGARIRSEMGGPPLTLKDHSQRLVRASCTCANGVRERTVLAHIVTYR